MKLKFLIPFISIIVLYNCGSTDKGQNCADTFFAHIINEKYDSALYLMENMSPTDSISLANIKTFGNNPNLGKLIAVEKSFGFSTNINNGVSTVKLPYKLQYEKSLLSREVTIVNKGRGYKIRLIE